MKLDITDEAYNCIKFWQDHDMYGGTPSDVILEQMREWLNRDMLFASSKEIAKEFNRIMTGD